MRLHEFVIPLYEMSPDEFSRQVPSDFMFTRSPSAEEYQEYQVEIPHEHLPKVLYHVTPAKNLLSIMRQGLQPRTSKLGEHPNAIFFTPSFHRALRLARLLVSARRDLEKTHKWIDDHAILKIRTDRMPEKKFYYDPASVGEEGAYTLEPIEPKGIELFDIVDADILRNARNWRKFWNWYIWGGEKPAFVRKFRGEEGR